ncbi:hypothetical protein ANOM_010872 [Aspergillus nomiae NRRL 13137]|uniref:Uncharacterized protein n=1 Tax=Aspergillus nomiae NRRL (strain ATCC 15546 / NRRL 13137 / CBS 260.88 / M93) TaxID=1509407 RepID=A0A0L1IN51_ASPN3|nr:uncharacterized protein ANOM_010872 [Aspergillus nomiae NRRL 13137]KNG81026.1 hypothetical protein ANOM_010872 [Aspergillus nomiae NRRL 13137]
MVRSDSETNPKTGTFEFLILVILSANLSGFAPCLASGSFRPLTITTASNGDKVAVTSRDSSKSDDLKEHGIMPTKLEVRYEVEIQAVVGNVESIIGLIDILVNNVGYIIQGVMKECR